MGFTDSHHIQQSFTCSRVKFRMSVFNALTMNWADDVVPPPPSAKVGVPVTSYSCVENVSSPSRASEPLHAKICPQGANCKYSENIEHCKKVLEVYLNKSAARKAGGEASSTPCKFGDKCTRGMKCPFVHNAQPAAKNLTPSPAAGGGKKKPAEKTHICSRNEQYGDCPLCIISDCSYASSWEELDAIHASKLKKNPNFKVHVKILKGRIEGPLSPLSAPYNGVVLGNGFAALTPAAYCEWYKATRHEHESADAKLAKALRERDSAVEAVGIAVGIVGSAIVAGADAMTALAASQEREQAAIAVGARVLTCVPMSL